MDVRWMTAARIALAVPLVMASAFGAAPAHAGKAVNTACTVTISGSKMTYTSLAVAVAATTGGETLTIGGVCKGYTTITEKSLTLTAARGGGVLDGGGLTDHAVLEVVNSSASAVTVTITGITIRGGGASGINCASAVSSLTDLTINGGAKIIGNRASRGGGIHAEFCRVTVSDAGTEIGSNYAINWGGGLYILGSLYVTSGAVVDFNQAGEWAGGIMCDGASLVVIEGGAKVLSNLAAGFGGGAFSYYECTLHVRGAGTEFAHNAVSTGAGGAIEAYDGGSVIINGPTSTRAVPVRIHDNSAPSGGGIAFSGAIGSLTLSGRAFIYGNTAGQGGGFYLATYPNLTAGSYAGSTCGDAAGNNPNSPNDWDASTNSSCA